MNREPHYLLDMLNAIQTLQSHTTGKTKQNLIEDIMLQDAVIRRLEIFGEAARRISDKTRSEIPEIPWQKIIGMRNVLAHQYNEIDLDIVWDVIHQELPKLLSILEQEIAMRTANQ